MPPLIFSRVSLLSDGTLASTAKNLPLGRVNIKIINMQNFDAVPCLVSASIIEQNKNDDGEGISLMHRIQQTAANIDVSWQSDAGVELNIGQSLFVRFESAVLTAVANGQTCFATIGYEKVTGK